MFLGSIGNPPEQTVDPREICPEELISGSELFSPGISDDHSEATRYDAPDLSSPVSAQNGQPKGELFSSFLWCPYPSMLTEIQTVALLHRRTIHYKVIWRKTY
jgi:hypothetical protein